MVLPLDKQYYKPTGAAGQNKGMEINESHVHRSTFINAVSYISYIEVADGLRRLFHCVFRYIAYIPALNSVF